jgi:hypothetical protein
MLFDKFALAVAVVTTLTLPRLSQATSMFHAENSEAGLTFQSDHFQSSKSREDVLAELEAARKDGTLDLIQRGKPLPIKTDGPATTRQQVIDGMHNETPRQRRVRMELTRGG